MRRREFIAGLGSAAAAWPLAAQAQQPDDRVRFLMSRILRMQAEALAGNIGQFLKEIESHVGWTVLPWSAGTIDQRRFDGLRLLRQSTAITELSQLDSSGKEQLRVSRLATDVVGSNRDYSQDPKFTVAMEKKVYYGPVYRGSKMTMSVAGTRRDAGVSVVEFDLKPIEDLVTITKVGDHGTAYVLDAQDRVIADRDSNLVQHDFSSLPHVQAARTAGSGPHGGAAQVSRDINGREVLATYEPVAGPNWLVFVELPAEEANAPAR
jgi:hypothetical protein